MNKYVYPILIETHFDSVMMTIMIEENQKNSGNLKYKLYQQWWTI